MAKNYKYKHKNKPMSFGELLELSVVDSAVLWHRINSGWTISDAITLPLRGPGTTQKYKAQELKDRTSYYRHTVNTTKASMKKGETNHKLEELIEKRLLDKELEDY